MSSLHPTTDTGTVNSVACKQKNHARRTWSCLYPPEKDTPSGPSDKLPPVPTGSGWQNGGRKNCTATDPAFQEAEGDLVNLVPAVGEVNGDRNNFPYSAWTRHPEPIYGQCKTIVDFQMKRAQPREEVRGRAARISLYMSERYQLRLSKQDKQPFCAWAKTYPIDSWETQRDKRIAVIQGNGNPFVSDAGHVEEFCQG